MKLARFRLPFTPPLVGVVEDSRIVPLDLPRDGCTTLASVLESPHPAERARSLACPRSALKLADVQLLPPIDEQEVWAAGVTYKRSRAARMEESEAAASCYDRVYESPRPELFFKATPHRVVGPGQPIRIRRDSAWNVPEPEVTLVLNSKIQLVGFTVGNDVSSRDIEGENPLYLPQAKVYDGCCSLGPWITLAEAMPPGENIAVELAIERGNQVVFRGATSVAQMARTFGDLIDWLGRDNSFPRGAFLLTGTGIVPDRDFTLLPSDSVAITVGGIGTLRNTVIQYGPGSHAAAENPT